MGNFVRKNTNGVSTFEESSLISKTNHQFEPKQEGNIDNSRSAKKNFSKNSQNYRQNSAWSLGSLREYWNWSYSGSRYSLRNRNKLSRTSLHSSQRRRSKTVWHRPVSNAIFISHFKESCTKKLSIDHLIAKGSFGVVFKVIDKRELNESNKRQTSYALKVLKKSKIIEENSVQQIKEEADIQKLCGHHIYIVEQIDLWQDRRSLFILSEYVPNGELFSKISCFSSDLIRLYLAEIALAVDFLHNAGVIYRDAKPENILLAHNYHIKLTDFGLSKWLKLGATTRTMCGTFQYMAPEILRGEPYGHSVDWWSLGIIAYQMYTNQSPEIQKYLNDVLPADEKTSESCIMSDTFNDTTDNFAPQSKTDAYLESRQFFADNLQNIPSEGQDIIKRLLEINPKVRIHSVLMLQKIALYQNFKIEIEHLQSISPLGIMAKDNIIFSEKEATDDQLSLSLDKEAFKGF